MAGNLIRSAILEGAAELMRSRGVHPAAVARAVGLPPRALSDPHLLVSATSAVRLFELAAKRCRLRTFCLLLARQGHLASIIGPLWILLRNARTVEEMCRELVDNFDLFSGSAMFSLEPVESGALLTWSLTTPEAESEVQTSEFSLAHLVKEIRSTMGRDWTPEATLFRHARPAGSLKLHREVFGTDIRFNQDCNALVLDSKTLAASFRGRGSAARALADRYVRLEEDVPQRSIARTVEVVIRTLMPYGPCTVRDVSRALDIAPRTLQKYLRQEGTTFVTTRDAVRADLAFKYLRYSNLSVVQVAEILGYSDATSLSRSFRRWHGRSAREARRRWMHSGLDPEPDAG